MYLGGWPPGRLEEDVGSSRTFRIEIAGACYTWWGWGGSTTDFRWGRASTRLGRTTSSCTCQWWVLNLLREFGRNFQRAGVRGVPLFPLNLDVDFSGITNIQSLQRCKLVYKPKKIGCKRMVVDGNKKNRKSEVDDQHDLVMSRSSNKLRKFFKSHLLVQQQQRPYQCVQTPRHSSRNTMTVTPPCTTMMTTNNVRDTDDEGTKDGRSNRHSSKGPGARFMY